MIICTYDENNNECWTNPPCRNISEVWDFIKHIFKDKYIKSFRFYGENKIYFNPKIKYIQGDLF